MNVFATRTLFSQSNQHMNDMLSCHEDTTCKDDQLACEIEAHVDCMMADLRSIKMKLGVMQEKHRKFEQQSKTQSAENIKLIEQLRASSSDLEDSKSLNDKLRTSQHEQSEEMKTLKLEKLVLETFCKKTYQDLVELV